MNRRKLKGEIELVADFKKLHENYCNLQPSCKQCDLNDREQLCDTVYFLKLLRIYNTGGKHQTK